MTISWPFLGSQPKNTVRKFSFCMVIWNWYRVLKKYSFHHYPVWLWNRALRYWNTLYMYGSLNVVLGTNSMVRLIWSINDITVWTINLWHKSDTYVSLDAAYHLSLIPLCKIFRTGLNTPWRGTIKGNIIPSFGLLN